MKFSKKKIAVFYIEKDQARYIDDKGFVAKLNFSNELFENLEIVDREKFSLYLEKFIKDKKLQPVNIFILLGKDLVFEKDISEIPVAEKADKIREFLEVVPFEETVEKVFQLDKKTKIIAANGSFCNTLIDIFQNNNFIIEGVVPLSVVEEKVPQLVNKLDLRLVLGKIGGMKKYNLISYDKKEREIDGSSNLKSPRLIILGSVLIVLLLVLIMLLTKNFFLR